MAVITGTPDNDLLVGFDGNDELQGGDGDDTLDGGAGDDILHNEGGVDSFSGGLGNDTFVLGHNETVAGEVFDGGDGIDTLNLVGDNDLSGAQVTAIERLVFEVGARATLSAAQAASAWSIVGSTASDAIRVTGGSTDLSAWTFNGWQDGQDTITVVGSSGNDTIKGSSKNDELQGGDGDDTLDGGAGDDILNGGLGSDTAIFAKARGDYTFALAANGSLIVQGGGFVDAISNVESFQFSDGTYSLSQLLALITPVEPPPPPTSYTTSSSFTLPANALNLTATGKAHVKLTGNALNNSIIGNAGNNTIGGGHGNDKLSGGLGKDILTGGSGKDIFVFNTKLNAKTNLDKIVDFSVKDDTIWLDNAVFTKLGKGSVTKPGKLNKAFFTIGDKAKDKNDYLIYNSKTGVLFYDADGSGSKAAVAIATLKKGLKLTYADFFVI